MSQERTMSRTEEGKEKFIQGIIDLGKHKNPYSPSILDLPGQSNYIKELLSDLPRYIRKCESLKGISRDKAKKIQNELYEIKRYIQSLSTWDLSKSKRKKILDYLNLIEADIGSIIMSEEVEVDADYDLPDILNEDYFKNPQDDATNETRLGGRGKKIKKYNYNIMTKPARRSRKTMRGGYVWRTPKTRSRSTRRRTPRSKRSRKTRFF